MTILGRTVNFDLILSSVEIYLCLKVKTEVSIGTLHKWIIVAVGMGEETGIIFTVEIIICALIFFSLKVRAKFHKITNP